MGSGKNLTKWEEGIEDMRTYKWLALCMAIVLVMLTGCQSIGGIDVTKVLKKQLDIHAYEAQQTMSIHFEPASGKLKDEDAAMMKAFNDALLTVQVKAQDPEHFSMTGKLKVASDEVPFTIGLKDNRMVIKVEGAQSPIVIGEEMKTMLSIVQPSTKQMKAFVESTFALLGKHAPNPANASVKQVTEQVMGQSLSLSQVHIEFGGNELIPWLKQLLQSALKDEEGLKAWFMEMGKWYAPMITAAIAQAGHEMEGEIPALLKDGELLGLTAYKMFKEQAPAIISELERSNDTWLKDNSGLTALLSGETKLVLDLYVDQNMNVRKSKASLAIAVPTSAEAPFTKVTINQSTEYSNVNGTVKADEWEATSSYVSLTDPEMTPGKWLRHFDSSSVAHKWLKQAGITKKWTTIPVSASNYDEWFYEGMAMTYTKNGTMMVPLRVVTDEFDAKLKWEGKSKLTIIDDITGVVTELTMNSKQAKVGGQTVDMPLAPEEKDGQLYVPLRSLAQMLGFTFTINKSDGTQWLEMNRE